VSAAQEIALYSRLLGVEPILSSNDELIGASS